MKIERRDITHDPKPTRCQDILAIKQVYENGLFRLADSRYSMSYKLKDVDYQSLSDDSRYTIFDTWSELLNSLDGSKASAKLTIVNRRINKKRVLEQTLLSFINDGYDDLREAYNELRRDDVNGDNGIFQEKFLTLSAMQRNEEKAQAYFRRLEREINLKLSSFDSSAKAVPLFERGELIHSFMRAGNESSYQFEWREKNNTIRFKDACSVDYFRPAYNYFELGDMVGRCMMIKSFGTCLKDDFITRLAEIKTNLMLTIDIIPVSNAEARKTIEHKDDDVENNAHIWSNKKAVRDGSAMRLPRQVAKDRKVIDAYNKAMDEDNQKMFLVQVLVCFLAPDMAKLEEYTDSITDTAAEYNCEMSKLTSQQLKGLMDVLPVGVRKIKYLRDCDTDTTAILMPFNTVSLNHLSGIPYGRHDVTGEQQYVDRRYQKPNGHEWLLGVTGSGKSGNAKLKIFYEALLMDGDIIVLDPDGEYAPLIKSLGGQVIKVGQDHINIADISRDYGYIDGIHDADPIKKKSNLIISFFDAILDDDTQFREIEKSLVDRAVKELEKNVLEGYSSSTNLIDIYDMLIQYGTSGIKEATQLALALERHIKGSFNCFAKDTNVKLQARIICYDLSTLSKQEKDAGMIVVLDQVDQKLIHNRKLGRATFVTMDEMDYFFKHASSISIIEDFFERARKYGGFLRAIVQNVSKVLASPEACTMLKNSNNVIMMRQHPEDAAILESLYDLSSLQVKELIKAENGHGINKIGNVMYSFDGTIPVNNRIFNLIDTTVVKAS